MIVQQGNLEPPRGCVSPRADGVTLSSQPEERAQEGGAELNRVNAWLPACCHTQGFGFYNHGSTFEKLSLLGADGIHQGQIVPDRSGGL